MSAREGKSVKRFERSNGLDTALYKNYLLPPGCDVEKFKRTSPNLPQVARRTKDETGAQRL